MLARGRAWPPQEVWRFWGSRQHGPVWALPHSRLRGEKRFPRRHHPCVFQALRGDFPEVYLHGRCGGSGRRRFIFTVGVCGGDLGSASLALPSPPLGHQPRDALAAGWGRSESPAPSPGKRARKETFPSMIVLPLAERVMKILGKCYTTRG